MNCLPELFLRRHYNTNISLPVVIHIDSSKAALAGRRSNLSWNQYFARSKQQIAPRKA